MTFLQQGGENWLKFILQSVAQLCLPVSLVSWMIQGRGGKGKIVLIAVEAIPAGSKPSAADDSMRTSIVGRCGFDASATLLTRASPMHFLEARGSAFMPKLVKLIGPSSTLAEKLSPFFTQSAGAPSVRLRVFIYISTAASVARRGW